MPRSAQSIESRILEYFRTAPPETAWLLFGLIKAELPERAPLRRRQRRKEPESPAKDAISSVTTPPPRRKRQSRGSTPLPGAEVEQFGEN